MVAAMEPGNDLQHAPDTGESGAMRDPGLDRHEWETAWAGLQEQLEESPAEALPDLGDLIEEMLSTRGFPIHDEVADDGIDSDILVSFRSAREVTLRVERGDDVDPSDIGEAIHSYRDIYAELIARPDN
jgi:hypothetical protein